MHLWGFLENLKYYEKVNNNVIKVLKKPKKEINSYLKNKKTINNDDH